jgi:hypothetical protein
MTHDDGIRSCSNRPASSSSSVVRRRDESDRARFPFDPLRRSLCRSSQRKTTTTTSRRREKAKARLAPLMNGDIDFSALASSVGSLFLLDILPGGVETPSSIFRSWFIMYRAVQTVRAACSPFCHLLFHRETTLGLIIITQNDMLRAWYKKRPDPKRYSSVVASVFQQHGNSFNKTRIRQIVFSFLNRTPRNNTRNVCALAVCARIHPCPSPTHARSRPRWHSLPYDPGRTRGSNTRYQCAPAIWTGFDHWPGPKHEAFCHVLHSVPCYLGRTPCSKSPCPCAPAM